MIQKDNLIENLNLGVTRAKEAGYSKKEIVAAVEYIYDSPELQILGAIFTSPYIDDCL